MKTERRSRCVRFAVGAVLGMLAGACSTQQALREVLPSSDRTSSLGGAMASFERLPYASMLLRVGNRFQALLLLGHVSPGGVQTWYGADGLAVQLRDDRLIYSRGLPVDIFESHVAGTPNDEAVDCGEGSSVTVRERLHYTRLRGQQAYFTEMIESVRCDREAIVTPGYSGPALRVEERVALLPHPRRQTRTRWLAEGSGQLLRVEYSDHSWYPQIALYLIKPVAPR